MQNALNQAVADALVNSAARRIQSVYRGYAARRANPYVRGTGRGRTRRRGNRPKYIKGRKTFTTKGKTIKAQIKDIKKSIKADQGEHIRRVREVDAVLTSNVNQCRYLDLFDTTCTKLQGYCTSLRFYDAATNSLVTANPTSNTYTQQIHFKSIHKRITARNNYQVPCTVTIHSMLPKNDTNNDPIAFYAAGLADQAISTTQTSPLVHLTDIDNVTTNWRCVKTFKRYLEPGKQCSFSWNSKSFDFDPSEFDTHALEYQTKYHTHVWCVRVDPVIAHDTIADEQGFGLCGVDVYNDTKIHILYDAGASVKDFSQSNGSSTFTNGAVVSNKPVSDNQSYSVA